MTQDPILGVFPLASGSGFFGDNNATNYNNGGDEVQLIAHTELPTSNNWTNTGDIPVNFGVAGTYKYFIFIFGQVFGTTQSNPQTLFGVDNVILPTQSNPQTLSIQDENIKSEFSIYPNPFKNELFVTNLENIYSFIIYDITGKTLIKGYQSEKKIDVSSLKKGFYFISIQTENKKIIKKLIKN
jgi:hypothetical protein